MQIGVYTFGDTAPDPRTGHRLDFPQRLRNLVEEAELADQAGLDVFGVGEHHRPDFAVSAPAVVLAAAASRTSRILLDSAVTVLSSEDPVRVFQQFATLDGLSNGRAEIIAGRGSFIESFPLFGYALDDYDALFAEKLGLLLQLREEETVTWSGRFRTPIEARGVYPRPQQERLPIWIAVGGTPASAVRAASLGLPLAVAIIGGQPRRFAPLVDLYRDAAAQAGRDPAALPVAINSIGFVADSAQAAWDAWVPHYMALMTQIGKERGWPPSSEAQVRALAGPEGALLLGEPEQVAEKILRQHEYFRNDRFVLQMSIGAVEHRNVLRAIELLGTKVAPLVKAEVARRQPAPTPA